MTPALRDDPPAAESNYWLRTRNPFTCLVFVVPLLVVYELGVDRFGGSHPELLRNGADHWMRQWLLEAGLRHPSFLPSLVILALLGWQICGKFTWQISFETLVGMCAESLLFAFCLMVVGRVQDVIFQHYGALAPLAAGKGQVSLEWLRVVSFVGAGIYEEVLFRLCLIPLCYTAFRLLLLPRKWAAGSCIVATSIVFAAAHYIGPGADQFSTFNFSFRVLAGFAFALLFTLRGFGIAVGCHAAYDVLVGVLLHSPT